MKRILFLLLLLPFFAHATKVVKGSGTGRLPITSSNTSVSPGDTIEITPGSGYGGYPNGILIQGIRGTALNPVVIINGSSGAGIVNVTGGRFDIQECAYIKITGTGKAGVDYGFQIRDMSDGGTYIDNSDSASTDITFDHVMYKNINNNYLFRIISTIAYNASDEAATLFNNWKFINCWFENVGSIWLTGDWHVTGGVVNNNLFKNIEIRGCTFKKCDQGGGFLMENVQGGRIVDNVIDSFCLSNTGHVCVFHIQGYVDTIARNKMTNCYGQIFRLWGVKQGATGTAYIFNNIEWNSLKYSLGEIQTFSSDINGTNGRYLDYYVYNNTVGKLNTNHDWQGAVIDKYDMSSGHMYVRNNLSYNTYVSSGNHIVNYAGGSDDANVVESNNAYYSTYTAAGLSDEVSFNPSSGSPVLGAGTTTGFTVTKDYYGTSRPNPPAIGAADIQGATQLGTPSVSNSSVTSTTATISWGAITNATNYIVERSTASDFTGATQVYSGGSTSFNATGLSASTTYYFRVKAQASGFTDSDWGTTNFTTSSAGGGITNRYYFLLEPKIYKVQ